MLRRSSMIFINGMILPFKCHLLLEPIQMSFANGAHSNVICKWSPFKCEFLRRFSGDSQEILRRFSGDSQEILRRFSGDSQEILRRFSGGSQEILRRFSGDAQEILIDFQEWNDSPIQMSFANGAHSNVSSLGDSQEILRRFSGDSQEILRRFSGDSQKMLRKSSLIFRNGMILPFKCHLQMEPIQM